MRDNFGLASDINTFNGVYWTRQSCPHLGLGSKKSSYIDGNLQGVLQVIAREEFRFHTQITQNKWV